ncbi:tumor necrosis factor ligand superfamily member 6-like [Leucoraja erinacea]|uniref:tumor necrosis factor ligand superfamily member 6-like n=1 Tax=Leucoraja erinaceus TaxID=7782 RepID=UPI002455F069|nr:tumor necrosis factor ligand superfamily member 6-like [Leucoraja erinacea]
MQRNYPYPQVFMVDGNPNLNPYMQAPVWTLPTIKKRRKLGCKTVGSVLILNLVLLVLAWLALGSIKLIELQRDIKEIKEDHKEKGPYAEKIVGTRNVTESPKNLKAAAHLTGYYNSDYTNPLMWNHQTGHAIIRGVTYKDCGLVVNQTGLFVVYSKIYFRGYKCERRKNLEHILFKRSTRYSKDLILMESEKTDYCSLNYNNWNTNSYQAGIVTLTKGDSLYVNVSYPRLVDSDESKTFFGLYKL